MSADSFQIPRTKDKLISIFQRIGYDHIDNRVFDLIFDVAANGQNKVSINIFRNSLNEYLDAIETNNEENWLSYHGIL